MLGLHISLHKAIDDVTSRLGHGNNRQPRKRANDNESIGGSQLLRLDGLKKIGSMVPKGLQIQVRCTGCE